MQSTAQMQLAGADEAAIEREFLRREAASRDTIDVKRSYIDVGGGLAEGVLLSQLVYWFLPAKGGGYRTTLEKRGRRWLAKQRTDWWDECRISEKVYDRAIKVLQSRGLVMVQLFRFGGKPTPHISLCFGRLMEAMDAAEAAPLSRADFTQRSKSDFTERSKSILPKGENETLPIGGNHSTETTHRVPAETTPPPTPASGGECDAELREGDEQKPKTSQKGNAGEVPTLLALVMHDPPELAGEVRRVMWECGFTKPKLAEPIARQIRMMLRGDVYAIANCKGSGCAAAVADGMISAWREYVELGPVLTCQYGPARFFDEGLWARRETWRVDEEKQRALRPAKTAPRNPGALVMPQAPPGADVELAAEVWAGIVKRLRTFVNQGSFDTWIRLVRAAWVLHGALMLVIPNKHFEHVRVTWGADIAEALPRTVSSVAWIVATQDVVGTKE